MQAVPGLVDQPGDTWRRKAAAGAKSRPTLTTFSAASKSTPHPECVFTMSDATQHTRPTQIAKRYQTPDSGVFSEDGSARFVRSPQALQTQQHGEHALEFAI